ncbi:MAG: nitroreductase family protein [Anaerolineales bacterium]|nr:nitroreductase family protein [Anaerolineales bacterium]
MMVGRQLTADLHDFLRTRRSIRRFTPDPVPAAVIERILETATYAPSAHNKQPWRFAVVTDLSAKARLAEAICARFRADMTADAAPEEEIANRIARTIRRTTEAPLVIVLCREVTQVRPQPDIVRQQAESTMGMQSVAMAGLQLLLSAHAEGLGGTWICWPLFAPQETRAALDLPAEWEPQGMVFIGYSAEEPPIPGRKPLSEITLFR